MKISQTNWFAIVEGVECRLKSNTKQYKSTVDTILKDWWYIDDYWFIRYADSCPYLITQKAHRIQNAMTKLWYTEFDYDTKGYPLVKCYL